jgi:hypothetical protein
MKNKYSVNFHFMSLLSIIVGVIGIASQFLAGWELLAFVMNLAVLGGLIGGSNTYELEERLKLERNYKLVFEWLLLVVLIAYAVLELAKWLPLNGVVIFLNGHWPGLVIATMCVLMGIAGLRERWNR